MTPKYPYNPDQNAPRQERRPTNLARTSGRGKGKPQKDMGGIKKLLAVASVTATLGGWAMFAGHDATPVTATQGSSDQNSVASLVSQVTASTATSTVTAVPSLTTTAIATSTATQQAITITTQPTSTTAEAPATATTAPTLTATATSTTAAPTATSTPKSVKVAPTAVTRTRSSS